MLEFHLRGGLEWMAPLSLLLLILLGLIGYAVYCRTIRREVPPRWLSTIKHVGRLALAWGVLSEVSGLYSIFQSIQAAKQAPSLETLMGGMEVLIIALVYALIIFIISLVAYLLLRLPGRNVPVNEK